MTALVIRCAAGASVLAALGTGCSSLQRYHAYRLDADANAKGSGAESSVASSCARPLKGEEETVRLAYPGAEPIDLSFYLRSGFGLWGPPLVPFIPSPGASDLVGIRVVVPTAHLTVNPGNWTLRSDRGEMPLVRVAQQFERFCDPSVSARDALTPSSDAARDPRCENRSSGFLLIFELREGATPDRLTLVVDGVRVDDRPQPARTVVFGHSTFWSYGPIGAANNRLQFHAPRCE